MKKNGQDNQKPQKPPKKISQNQISQKQIQKSTSSLNPKIPLSSPKFLSPKTMFNFKSPSDQASLKKSRSQKKINSSKITYNDISGYNITNNTSFVYSSADNYWQKRELETQEKLNRIRNEQLLKEQGEMRDRPQISKNSLKIASKIRNSQSKEKVFERLTSGVDLRKREEEIQKIERITSKNRTPAINTSSQKIKRTVDDLFRWKVNIDKKKSETINQIINTSKNSFTPHPCEVSEEILRQRKPDYLNKRVEDRLLEQGAKARLKKEEQKEQYIENITMNKKPVEENKVNNYANIESRYLDPSYSRSTYNSNRKSHSEIPIKLQNKTKAINSQRSKSKEKLIKKNAPSLNKSTQNVMPIQTGQVVETNPNNDKTSKFNVLLDIRRHLNSYYDNKRKIDSASFSGTRGNNVQGDNYIYNQYYKGEENDFPIETYEGLERQNQEIIDKQMMEDTVNTKIPKHEPFEKTAQFGYSIVNTYQNRTNFNFQDNVSHIPGKFEDDRKSFNFQDNVNCIPRKVEENNFMVNYNSKPQRTYNYNTNAINVPNANLNSNNIAFREARVIPTQVDNREKKAVPLSELANNKPLPRYQYQQNPTNQYSVREKTQIFANQINNSENFIAQPRFVQPQYSGEIQHNFNIDSYDRNSSSKKTEERQPKKLEDVIINTTPQDTRSQMQTGKEENYCSSLPKYKFNQEVFNRFTKSKEEITRNIMQEPQGRAKTFSNPLEISVSRQSQNYTEERNEKSVTPNLNNRRMQDLQQMMNFASNLRSENACNTMTVSRKSNNEPINTDNLTSSTNKTPVKGSNNNNFDYFNYYSNNYFNNDNDYNDINYLNQRLKMNENNKNSLTEKLNQFSTFGGM